MTPEEMEALRQRCRPVAADGRLAVLEQNLEIVRKFKPMEAAEMDALRERCHTFAADGRYERFKTTKSMTAILVASSKGIQRQRNYLPECVREKAQFWSISGSSAAGVRRVIGIEANARRLAR
jgi:hypothetical protein